MYIAESCMFFVGGNDVKANNDSAGDNSVGGCTKAWWIEQLTVDEVLLVPGDAGYDAAAIAAMDKLMDANGDAHYAEDCVVWSWGAGYIELVGITNVEVGMLVWVDELGGADILADGEGVYKIIEIVDSSTVKIGATAHVDIQQYDECDLYIGGAWEEVDGLAEEISAANYSQEIFCNKDYNPLDWVFADWGYGDKLNNTWLKIRGFNRVPHDTTDKRGSSYESIKDAEDNGADPTDASWVNLDLDHREGTFMIPGFSENIQISGFRFYNQASDQLIFNTTSSDTYSNIDISHNAFKVKL